MQQPHQNNTRNKARGFTLVETLVSVLILALVLTTVTALLVTNIRATTASKDRLIAVRLAQEGIELIKSKRAINLDEGEFWLSNLLGEVWEPDATQEAEREFGNHFRIGDPADPAVVCVRTVPPKHAGKYWYNCTDPQSAIVPGNFTRQVTLKQINPYSASVTATVTWNNGTDVYTVSTVLYEIS